MKRLKYLHTYRDTRGVFRSYVRRKGQPQIPIYGKLGSRQFMAAYEAAVNARYPVKPPQDVEPADYGEGPHIYFIRGSRHLKIGITTKPERRITEIQAASPVPLRVLQVVPGDVKLERKIHRRFQHLRRHGEWFFAMPELLAFIDKARMNHEQGVAITEKILATPHQKDHELSEA